ncbi:MAG: UDP-N-acetylmuramate--L-alanine ligase [Bacteroidales bacterium]|nr:UDP-N-acetylmuramate--L-alanine ligase [Bacteroidales bacterium]
MKSKTYYFVGIGGIGMSAIARYLKQTGNNILGYDRTPTALTEELVAEGMDIKYEDDPSHIANRHIDMVIYTPAIGDDNRILQYARENALVVKKRSEVLGLITNQKKTIAVAGTHGKTTTSGMIAHILTKSNIGCSAFLGGISNNYHTNCLINPDSDYVVVEADEYDRSFLQLSPYMSVITSVEADHLDIYGTLSEVEKAFACFADKTDKSGKLFVKDTLCERIAFEHKSLSYSLLEQTDYHVANIRVSKGKYYFDFYTPEKVYYDMQMTYPGRHNIENAVVALAVACSLGVGEYEMRAALSSFSGMKRRFDLRLKTDSTIYYDDYAHHPQEIGATISSLRELYPDKRLCGVFQPHLYSRTKDFADEFAKSLEQLDDVILLPIYPAREEPIAGVSSKMILHKINKMDKYCVDKSQLFPLLEALNPELLVTMGAGDIDKLVEPITDLLKENE